VKTFILPALASLVLLLLAPAANAADEVGDAGDLPATAQDLTGAPVESIAGTLVEGTDIDMYRLCLDGGGSFSASAVGGTAVDTQLFLFDASGRGVYANDDQQEGVVIQSLLPAGHPLTPSAQGEYLLAVGAYNIDPQSAGGAIFPALADVTGPTGPGGGEPLIGWGGRHEVPGAYTLTITGARCAPGDDTTPPTIDLRSPVDGAVVRPGDPVEVDFSCADAGGSLLASCDGTVPDGGMLDTSVPGPASVTVTARDHAGNQALVTHTVQVVPVDIMPPAIQILSPLDGAVYLLDEEVWADYTCTDGGTGVATCAGPVADGGRVDTSAVGPHEFTVNATDNAGNAGSATARFRVVYDFEAFLWPVRNRPKVNTWPAGLPVPIRFELGGNQGLDVIEDGWPQVAVVGCDFGEEPEAGEPARHPRWFRELVYRRRKQRYVFLWKTDRRWAGTCRQFMLKLKDGTVRRADFRFVKLRPHDDDDDDDRGSDSDSDSDRGSDSDSD
jgi:hypothetical protein